VSYYPSVGSNFPTIISSKPSTIQVPTLVNPTIQPIVRLSANLSVSFVSGDVREFKIVLPYLFLDSGVSTGLSNILVGNDDSSFNGLSYMMYGDTDTLKVVEGYAFLDFSGRSVSIAG
jgi:hypothetical protein